MAWHDTGTSAGLFKPSPLAGIQPGEHFEHPDTKRRLAELIETSGLLWHLDRMDPLPIEREDLERVHDATYLDWLERTSADGGGRVDGSSPFGQGSYQIACLAAGSTASAMDAVLEGWVDNAYALTRPPGHHARRKGGLGFCLINNVAVAIARSIARGDAERVAVVDFDVHHGNGTQDIFYADPNVLTISLHQDQLFPANSGHLHETGVGPGVGANLNVPLPPGSGRGAYLTAFDDVVLPALHRFAPDVIVVAAGYDAGAYDPLGRQMLTSATYREMTRKLLAAADELCDGHLVASHEGGYSPWAVPFHGLAVVEELAGTRTGVADPFARSFATAGQQDLQPHQRTAIDKAANLVANIPSPHAGHQPR
ncbi:class II histone deacetylase [Saccharopolyspora taberi]